MDQSIDQSSDVYFDSIGQVKASTFSRGRVALRGDAAYCPSPISGMGTSLAFVGAYILAGELARCSDYREAFLNYEKLMRPYVDKAQQLPPGSPRLAHPKTKTGMWLFHTMLRVASSPATLAISRRFSTPKAEQIVLPEYAGS
jgi:hypothetical protein